MLRCPLAWCAVAAAIASCHVASAQERVADSTRSYRLRAVRVETQDVFRPEEAGERFVPRLVNSLHALTRKETVMREVFVQPGDLVDVTHAAELERNLRALGIFAEVEVRMVPATTEGEADLVVRTRDRLTLAAGGGASYVGGTSGLNANVAESNLFGLGDRAALSFRSSDDGEFRGVASWQDLHLFDTWMRSTMRLSRTDEGDGIGVEVDRPFKHLRDPRSWRVGAAYDEVAQDYYFLGDEIASAPYRRGGIEAEVGHLHGDRFARSGFGAMARAVDIDYATATGAFGPSLRVPGDTQSVFVAATFRGRWIDSFRTATAMDTLGFVQDIALAQEVEIAAGGYVRSEDSSDTEVQPAVESHLGLAAEPIAGLLCGVATDGALRWGDDGLVGWRAEMRAQVALCWSDAHALLTSARFDAGDEQQDLPIQFTLGADSGLRGYDSRLFAGDRRLVASAEERWDTGIELWAFRIGLAAFVDAGWMSTSRDLGRPWIGTGGGLRIGSAPLFGSTVLRMDFSTALDDAEGNQGGLEFSVVVGQAFTFGGASRIAPLR